MGGHNPALDDGKDRVLINPEFLDYMSTTEYFSVEPDKDLSGAGDLGPEGVICLHYTKYQTCPIDQPLLRSYKWRFLGLMTITDL